MLTYHLHPLGAVPQTVRGLPSGFGGQQQQQQQQPQQPTRSVGSRLPNGKMGEQLSFPCGFDLARAAGTTLPSACSALTTR